jgi:hypothetical protein
MKITALICAAVALVCGVVSGVYWIRAARLPLNSGLPDSAVLPPLPPPQPKPLGQKSISMGGLGRYVGESGDLNWKAAAWSIAAVIFSALSSFLSAAS